MTELSCVNLQNEFGTTYKITWDPVYDAKGKHDPDPWSARIPGRYGEVFAYDNETLAVDIEGHPGIKERLKKLTCCSMSLDADFGSGTFHFLPEHLDEIAEIVKLYRRPRISEQQRDEMRLRMAEINSKSTRKPQSTEQLCFESSVYLA